MPEPDKNYKERGFSRRPEQVQCIRCDGYVNWVRALYYNQETDWVYLCPECFDHVRHRGS